MTETMFSRYAKVIFVTCLVIFIFNEKSFPALNIIKELVVNNILLIGVVVVIFLIWKTQK